MATPSDCLGPVVSALLAGVILGFEPALRGFLALALGPLLLLTILSGMGQAGGATNLRTCLHAGLVSLLLGVLLGVGSWKRTRPPPQLHVPALYELRARIEHVSLSGRGLQRVRVDQARLVDAGSDCPLPPLELIIDLGHGEAVGSPTLRPGDRIRCEALLKLRAESRAHGRGRLWGWISDPRLIRIETRGTSMDVVQAWREEVAASLERQLRPQDAGLARALILGDRERLQQADRMRFRETGQAHLLAVSGLHVGLVIAGLLLLIGRLGLNLILQMLLAMACTIGFVLLAGAPPSALRAGTAALLWMTALIFDRRTSGLRMLLIVGALVLLADAGNSHRAAFQMSFGAVLGILLLTPGLRNLLVRPRPVLPGYLPVVRAPLRSMFAVGAAAWLGTAPFVAFHIGRLCPWGPLVALPAIPLTALLIGTAALSLLGLVWEPLGVAPAFVFGLSADALRWWLDAVGWLGVRSQSVGRPPPLWWFAYGLAFWLAARASRRCVGSGVACMLAFVALLVLPGGLRVDATPARAADAPSREYDAPQSMTLLTPPQLAALPLASNDGSPITIAYVGATAAGLLLFAVLAVYLRWLRPGGAVVAWFLGMLAFSSFGTVSLVTGLSLFSTFLGATLLGKLPGAKKAGARSARQVLSNGLPAMIAAALALLVPELRVVGFAAYLGGLSCLGADTCATEIGTRFGGVPFRLLGRGPIASGESGGVTARGLIAALGGAWLPYLPLALLGWISPAFALFAAAGFAGALLDSMLGGTLQYRGRHPTTGEQTEKTRIDGVRTEHVSGWRWLDNDMVNLVSGLAAAGIAVGLYEIFF